MSPHQLSRNVWIHDTGSKPSRRFLTALQRKDANWTVVSDPKQAELWCIEDGAIDYKQVLDWFFEMGANKPRVVVLAKEPIKIPHKRWVLFKTPVNARILHAWLQVNFHATTKPNNYKKDKEIEKYWLSGYLKLRFWPNMSLYPDEHMGLVKVCSLLLHNWCTYDELLQQDIDAELLERVIRDAHSEHNLLYTAQPENNGGDTDDEQMGLLKRFFQKFSKK